MRYFKVDSDIYLSYDEASKTSSVISRTEIKELTDRLLKDMPEVPNDAELLEWANANYPGILNISNQNKRVDELQARLVELNKIR